MTTREHAYTLEHLVAKLGADRCEQWSYEALFRHEKWPWGAWVFTDHERLPAPDLECAAEIAGRLRQNGARVLNDPALVRSRFEILRRLESAGINRFSVYRADADPRPCRFPVFVRNEYDHRMGSVPLIGDQGTLEQDLAEREAGGQPLIGKLVIEYLGEEFLPRTWRRYSSYCVAGKIMAHHVGFDDQWIVKDGFNSERLAAHPHRDRLVEIERVFVEQNDYREVLERVFAIARIEYGRVDFALYDGNVQVFEINTNPYHGNQQRVLAATHPNRRASLWRAEADLHQAIESLLEGIPPQHGSDSTGAR